MDKTRQAAISAYDNFVTSRKPHYRSLSVIEAASSRLKSYLTTRENDLHSQVSIDEWGHVQKFKSLIDQRQVQQECEITRLKQQAVRQQLESQINERQELKQSRSNSQALEQKEFQLKAQQAEQDLHKALLEQRERALKEKRDREQSLLEAILLKINKQKIQREEAMQELSKVESIVEAGRTAQAEARAKARSQALLLQQQNTIQISHKRLLKQQQTI